MSAKMISQLGWNDRDISWWNQMTSEPRILVTDHPHLLSVSKMDAPTSYIHPASILFHLLFFYQRLSDARTSSNKKLSGSTANDNKMKMLSNTPHIQAQSIIKTNNNNSITGNHTNAAKSSPSNSKQRIKICYIQKLHNTQYTHTVLYYTACVTQLNYIYIYTLESFCS